MNTHALIDSFEHNFQRQKQLVIQEFKPLKHKQLNWRPQEGKWSIIECIEHLNIAARHYHKYSEIAIQKAEKKGYAFQPEYESSWLGNYLYKTMMPDENNQIKYKMKTIGVMRPDMSNINAPITMDEFIDRQDGFLELCDRMRNINIAKVRVKTLLGSILRLKLGDAIRFVDAHQERHLQQAKNVYTTDGFPAVH